MDILKILSTQRNIDIQANLPDGVIFTGTNGIIQWANDIAHNLFRVESSQLVSKSVNDLLENGYDLIVNSANTHKALISKYTQGEEYFEITAREIEGGYVVALRDSTQNYKRISNILGEKESSQKVNNDKNSFLVKLSNEFNSPIQSIIGFAQGLLDGLGGEVSEKQSKYINIIKKNSSELLYFFNKLVELSQSEGHLIDKDEKYFDVATLLSTLVKNNKHIYNDKANDITFDVDNEFKRMIYHDEVAFKIMIQNLLETVLREVDMGTISVAVTDADEDFLTARNLLLKSAILITISSVNLSVLETELPTLFNPYATIEKPNRRTISRALALGTVSNIVKDLGGVIWAENVPMKGLVFSIVIPRENMKNE